MTRKEQNGTSEPLVFVQTSEMFSFVKESFLGDKSYPEPINSNIGSYSRPETNFYLKITN